MVLSDMNSLCSAVTITGLVEQCAEQANHLIETVQDSSLVVGRLPPNVFEHFHCPPFPACPITEASVPCSYLLDESRVIDVIVRSSRPDALLKPMPIFTLLNCKCNCLLAWQHFLKLCQL